MNAELREKGYIPAKGLLEPGLARLIYKMLLLKQWRGECFRDNHIPTAASVSNTAETDALLLDLRPQIEAISGLLLVPTYTQLIYGDTTIRHHISAARSACRSTLAVMGVKAVCGLRQTIRLTWRPAMARSI
ncbi:MAG: hypothetical protein R3E79_07925 [Caldilineaceae bacterium]